MYKKDYLVYCILLFITYQISAISIYDIPGTDNIVNGSEVVHFIAHEVEPYAARWQRTWSFPVPRDTIRKRIYSLHDLLNRDSGKEKTGTVLLIKALLWHYLYQLEIDSAFNKANKCLSDAIKRNSGKRAYVKWLEGIHLVRASNLIEGLRILDSLRISELSDNSRFLSDYANLSRESFLPTSFYEADDHNLHLKRKRLLFRNVEIADSELQPGDMAWNVLNSEKPNANVPVFMFTNTYQLSGCIPLKYPSFFSDEPISLQINVHENFMKNVVLPIVFDYEIQVYPAQIKIITNLTDDKISMYDQLKTVVNNRFDMIKSGIEIGSLRGISLRCYNRSVYRNLPGQFYAYVIFDKSLKNKNNRFFTGPSSKIPASTDIAVRYFISLETSIAVQDKAEFILNSIVARFADSEE